MHDTGYTLTPEEVGILKGGDKIWAIREVRTRLDIDLVTAKKTCDDYEIALGIMIETKCPACGGTGMTYQRVVSLPQTSP